MRILSIQHLVAAAMLFTAPAAMSQAYGRVNITNYTLFRANVVVEYAACKSDAFVVSQGRSTGFMKVAPGVNQAQSRRGACLVTSIKAYLIGDESTVTAFESRGTADSQFVIAPDDKHLVQAPLKVFAKAVYDKMGERKY